MPLQSVPLYSHASFGYRNLVAPNLLNLGSVYIQTVPGDMGPWCMLVSEAGAAVEYWLFPSSYLVSTTILVTLAQAWAQELSISCCDWMQGQAAIASHVLEIFCTELEDLSLKINSVEGE